MGLRILLFGVVAALASATPLKQQLQDNATGITPLLSETDNARPGDHVLVERVTYEKLVDYAVFPPLSATVPGSAAPDPSCRATLFGHVNQESTDNQAAVWLRASTREIIFGIPGTNGLRDALSDVAALPTPYVSPSVRCPGVCLVHAGFLLAWNSIEGQVIDAVLSALEQNPGFSVVVSGHSLGGAMANLAFARLRSGPLNATTTSAYTYGQPKVGN